MEDLNISHASETAYGLVGNLAKAQRRPTIREQLEAQLVQAKVNVTNIEQALAALTPDIEKALDALRKIGLS